VREDRVGKRVCIGEMRYMKKIEGRSTVNVAVIIIKNKNVKNKQHKNQ
jgi:hypothetical protein